MPELRQSSTLARDNSADMALVHPKLISQGILAFPGVVSCSDLVNLGGREFGARIRRTSCLPSLGNFVSSIVRPRAKEKMRGIDALPVIAFVKDAQTNRNVPDMDYPRCPAGDLHSRVRTSPKHTIAVRVGGSRPRPTTVFMAASDVSPKARSECACPSSVSSITVKSGSHSNATQLILLNQ